MSGPMGPLSGIKCPDCGYYHPPLPQGEECPMKKKTDNSGNIIDTSLFFKNLKLMLEAQIQSKKIKDCKKLFGLVTLEINKYIENYKE